MARRLTILCVLLLAVAGAVRPLPAHAQDEERPLSIFGYFQSSFLYQIDHINDRTTNSFALPQLNVLMQKDFSRDWNAFVNFELLNAYRSGRWGSLNLEEAWVRYRMDHTFQLKLGLQIPIFNNLNEIKNRTPLLPYIFRPLVYETSFIEFIAIEDYLPTRAYVQTYGFMPVGSFKVDYAAYLGNGPNINSDASRGQTGVDTTGTVLVGGRLGLRRGDLKAGVSASHERSDVALPLEAGIATDVLPRYDEVPRVRIGADLSYISDRIYAESEVITVRYDVPDGGIDIDKFFAYGTFGFYLTERVLAYASYWFSRENFTFRDQLYVDINIPTIGASYTYRDRITFKGQYAYVRVAARGVTIDDEEYHVTALAVSVYF